MYMKKKVDKGTASRSLLLYCLKTKCLLKNRERGSEGWFVWGRVAGFLFFEVPIFRGHTGRSGGTLTRSSRRVPDALLRAPEGLAKTVEGFVADQGQLGPNAKRSLL